MNTPIIDFTDKYARSAPTRLHMPGHKGGDIGLCGAERFDLTEIPGADSLFEANGIIAESEGNASALFGSEATFYSTEGSSLCIRAMLYLALLRAKEQNKPQRILAVRNAHKAFLTAAGTLGVDVNWLVPDGSRHVCGGISPERIKKALEDGAFAAVYVTSPDYLGGTSDIVEISKICKEKKTLLLVDNAHGAYLKFCAVDRHPISLGADICCDSAHKTLPALTGGAYLHFGKGASELIPHARTALSLFGSTSPSYLILRSLDKVNALIAGGLDEEIRQTAQRVKSAKGRLEETGFEVFGDEELKLTVMPKKYGYTGKELDELLRGKNIYGEFSDPDFLALMPSPFNDVDALDRLCVALASLPRRKAINTRPPEIRLPKRELSIREALLSESAVLPIGDCVGRICAAPTASCPPAVPIVVSGERIDENAVELFKYYGIKECRVVK